MDVMKFDTSLTDAQYWAEKFMTIVKERNLEITEDLMMGWFANAIMAGYDEARRKYEMVNFHDFLMNSIREQNIINEHFEKIENKEDE
jgi:hypothetical protein